MSKNSEAEYYKLNVGELSDDLFHPEVPVEKWLATTTIAGKEGFSKGELCQLSNLPIDVELERLCGIAFYMIGNVLPFALPLLLVASFLSYYAKMILYGLLAYVFILWAIERFIFTPWFLEKYKKSDGTKLDIYKETSTRVNQYVFTERNTTKYLSLSFVWPKSLHQQNKGPLIFCLIPHGVGPIGITAYPVWSKVWNNRICHWTAAPMVMNLPVVSFFLKKMGYIPAKSKNIHETLTKKEENVGVILDGIAGMFQTHHNEETGYIRSRKGIIKIAMRAGATLVPVYAFGHTALWKVVVDPFGILEKLSNQFGISLTPFFGRWGWFLGPPRRVPVTVCLGEPIHFPTQDKPSKEQIDEYHEKMCHGFKQVFDKHKEAYGWEEKELKFV